MATAISPSFDSDSQIHQPPSPNSLHRLRSITSVPWCQSCSPQPITSHGVHYLLRSFVVTTSLASLMDLWPLYLNSPRSLTSMNSVQDFAQLRKAHPLQLHILNRLRRSLMSLQALELLLPTLSSYLLHFMAFHQSKNLLLMQSTSVLNRQPLMNYMVYYWAKKIQLANCKTSTALGSFQAFHSDLGSSAAIFLLLPQNSNSQTFAA